MRQLVLLRHGQSTWNQENRFTGWKDVPLSEKGVAEAVEAGRRLAGDRWQPGGFGFDVAFTSVLKRAIKTLWLALEELDQMWLPVARSWRLNERHYGALTGLDKAETAAEHGDEQVHVWRRSYDVRPPAFAPGDPANPALAPRYASMDIGEPPLVESLADTVARFLPYWEEAIVPELRAGKRVLIAAHGNSLRALVKHLDGISEAEITQLNIPTGIPLVYELQDDLTPLRSHYLAEDAELASAQRSVAQQGRARA